MDNEKKCSRNKRFLLFSVCLIFFLVICWHIYAHFISKASTAAQMKRSDQQEFYDFTKSLYKLESGNNPYLVKINFQGKTERDENNDVAPLPLLQVNDSALFMEELKTVYLLRRLFDNYELDTHKAENITFSKKQEQLDFLKAILDTPIMNKTLDYLVNKGAIFNSDSRSYLDLLYELWFMPYTRREGHLGSSGFEHVFLAELRGETVLGLHNWVYFAQQEEQGHLNYNGYISIKQLDKSNQFIVSFRSQFFNRTKPYNTIFVGTSPELEMSLYTLCFILHGSMPCPVQLGQLQFYIITYVWDHDGRETIASAFPSILNDPFCDIKDKKCV